MNGLNELVLELTEWCPLQCRHCSSGSGPCRKEHLARDTALGLIEEAASLGAAQVSLGGGEPTSSPLFLEVIERIAALGMQTEVYTCGATQEKDGLRPFSKNFIEAVCKVGSPKFIFSLHGPASEIHDYITSTPGSFDCLKTSLEACLTAGIHCELNFVPTRPNFEYFREVVQFAADRDLPKLSVLRFVPQGRGLAHRDELELSHQEESRFVEELLALREETSVEIRTGSPFNGIIPGNYTPCRAGSSKIVVQANGNVLPCEVFKHYKRRIWYLSAYEMSLSAILNSAQLRHLRERLGQSHCLECPIHAKLRTTLARGECYAVPETFVQV